METSRCHHRKHTQTYSMRHPAPTAIAAPFTTSTHVVHDLQGRLAVQLSSNCWPVSAGGRLNGGSTGLQCSA